jgi:hypothetical protein
MHTDTRPVMLLDPAKTPAWLNVWQSERFSLALASDAE